LIQGSSGLTISGAINGITISSGAILGATTINASGAITGGSLTDGAATLSSGALSGITTLSMSGALSGATTLSMSGALSGATTGAFSTSVSTPIVSNGGSSLSVGNTAGDVIIGGVGSASNLVFEENSTIHGQGTNTITIGASGDTINLNTSGTAYYLGRHGRTISATQTLIATNQIASDAPVVKVAGSGGAVTLTSDPSITDGLVGQQITIIGTSDTNTITITNNLGVKLGGATRVLGINDTLTLVYDGTDWLEIGFGNN